MTCRRSNLGGVTVITCTREEPRPCSSCGFSTEQGVLCDWPLTGSKAGKTCSKFCCRLCAKHVGEDRDYCPVHARMSEQQGIAADPVGPRTERDDGNSGTPPSRRDRAERRPLLVRTARISCGGADRLDVTRKSGVEGLPFAPSWSILRPALDARREGRAAEHWPAYVEAYTTEMRRSYRAHRAAWDALLARESVTLCCYCAPGDDGVLRCHRVLLAEILVKLGARYEGELCEPPTAQAPLGFDDIEGQEDVA